MSRQFDRYMLQVGIGTNRKLRRLPVAQRWAYVAGVLSLAAQSPLRGALLIADGEPATDQDVAEEATIPVKDARAALVSLRRMGMLDADEHGVEWVHDWDRLNPEPKPSDSPEAARERKRRQRARVKSRSDGGAVPRDTAAESRESHAPEVEVEGEVEEEPPIAPQGGRARDRQEYEEEMTAWAELHFPAAEPRRVAALVAFLRSAGHNPSASDLREYGREHPTWALESQEEPAAA